MSGKWSVSLFALLLITAEPIEATKTTAKTDFMLTRVLERKVADPRNDFPKSWLRSELGRKDIYGPKS
jgi:hypothetical protein